MSSFRFEGTNTNNGQIVIAVLERLSKPSTEGEILSFMSDSSGIPRAQMKVSLNYTLQGAVRYGYLGCRNRRYYLIEWLKTGQITFEETPRKMQKTSKKRSVGPRKSVSRRNVGHRSVGRRSVSHRSVNRRTPGKIEQKAVQISKKKSTTETAKQRKNTRKDSKKKQLDCQAKTKRKHTVCRQEKLPEDEALELEKQREVEIAEECKAYRSTTAHKQKMTEKKTVQKTLNKTKNLTAGQCKKIRKSCKFDGKSETRAKTGRTQDQLPKDAEMELEKQREIEIAEESQVKMTTNAHKQKMTEKKTVQKTLNNTKNLTAGQCKKIRKSDKRSIDGKSQTRAKTGRRQDKLDKEAAVQQKNVNEAKTVLECKAKKRKYECEQAEGNAENLAEAIDYVMDNDTSIDKAENMAQPIKKKRNL